MHAHRVYISRGRMGESAGECMYGELADHHHPNLRYRACFLRDYRYCAPLCVCVRGWVRLNCSFVLVNHSTQSVHGSGVDE